MHDIDLTQPEFGEAEAWEAESTEAEALETEAESAEAESESPFSEAEEELFAAELLEVTGEEELEQFLGRMINHLANRPGPVGGFVQKARQPFFGLLRAVAKKALPTVGAAVGSAIPIPGVGTAVGAALGKSAARLFEAELESYEGEDREFERARRFVRFAGSSAKQGARRSSGRNSRSASIRGMQAALRKKRRQAQRQRSARQRSMSQGSSASSGADQDDDSGSDISDSSDDSTAASVSVNETEWEGENTPPPASAPAPRRAGRWIRRGRSIVLLGA
ncbi:MAG TPA: hypothetical protein PLX89_12655 [Verrucomicrobiota bacterium]|nr:hypothetical protein [Verrucomicrobiales bacterium]HRI13842.1 hypothetical protein [Verrucomicrobiota bacterium]